ncbi:MAG: putative chagasin family peptidase inhibitor [Burkholderiaceae bacterium]|nr:putative chagasin family peptidase inhibitor [Burkholderiaceae bacterium]
MNTKSIRYIVSLCTVAAVSASLSACQTPQSMSKPTMPNTTIDTATNKQHLKVGDTFSIQLRSNPTTGYRWQLVEPFDKTLLDKVSNHYQADANPNHMVGVGGTETWTFKALKSGHTEIQLHYIRSWEAQNVAAKITKYQIKID